MVLVFLLLVLLLQRVGLCLALNIHHVIAQDLSVFLLFHGFENFLIMSLKLESEYLGNELLLLEVRFEVAVGLDSSTCTMRSK
jgi:hypothetical protein